MEEKLLLIYILQTFIATSISVTLPFPNAIGTVTPIKPRPPLPTSVPELLPSIRSLECDEDLLSPLFSSIDATRGFSSPIAVTSSSRALPVPKIDDLSLSNVKIPEGLVESLPASLRKLFKGPERNSNDCSTDISFPFKCLVKDTVNIPRLCVTTPECIKPRCEDMYFSSSVSEVLIKANPFVSPASKCSLPNPKTVLAANLKSPPVAPTNVFDSTLLKPTYNGLSSTPISMPNTVITPGSYPLSYKSRFLPKVRTPDFNFWNCKPYVQNGNVPTSCISPSISPSPPLPSYNLNSINEIKLGSDFGLRPPSKPTCEPVLPSLNPITKPERSNSFKTVQVPTITPPLPIIPGVSPCLVETPLPYKNPSPPSIGCENIYLPNPCKPSSVETKSCSENVLPIINSTPYVRVNDWTYSYPNGLPTVVSRTPCVTTPAIPTDTFYTKTPYPPPQIPCKENFPVIRPAPISAEELNRKNNEDNICSSVIAVPNTYPRANVLVDSLNNIQCVNIPNVCPSRDAYSCTSIPPIIPSIDCSRSFQHSASPTSYVSTSSGPISLSASKMVSSINDIVANITHNLLSSYFSCLKSEPKPVSKKPVISPKCIPKYQESKSISESKAIPVRSTLPPVNLSYEKPSTPIICQPTNYAPTGCPIIIQLDSLFPTNTPSFVSSSFPSNTPSFVSPLDTSPVPLVNFASPISPSYLPSPSLPYSPAPCYSEPPVVKISSGKGKKDKDILEFMILSELLDDDNYEWDELDTLLALLAIS